MKQIVFFLLLAGYAFAQPHPESNPGEKYPTPPQNGRLLFYLQRNKNANTVVYEANLLPNGKLNPKKPINVYWIRYTDGGTRKGLNYLQRALAYGVDSQQASDDSNEYILTPVALKERKIRVVMDNQGKPQGYVNINGRTAILDKIYAQAEETAWLPRVKYVDIIGKDPKTGQPVRERIFPHRKQS